MKAHSFPFYIGLFLVLSACSGGGGGGGSTLPDGGGANKTLSFANSTVESNLVYAKDGQEVTITVTPRDTTGAVMDISGKYDPQLMVLNQGGGGTSPTFEVNDMVLSGGIYTVKYTPDATGNVNLFLNFVGANYGNPNIGNVSTVKLNLLGWDECFDASPDSATSAQIWRRRGSYNLICDAADLMRVVYLYGASESYTSLGEIGVNDKYNAIETSLLSLSRETALLSSMSEDFVIMRDISDFSLLISFPNFIAGNRFFNARRTGSVYMNGKSVPNFVFDNGILSPDPQGPFDASRKLSGLPASF